MLVFFCGYFKGFGLGVFLILALACNAQAENKPHESCEAASCLARSIMSGRQSGVEMSKLIKLIGTLSDIQGGVAKGYVAMAYNYPIEVIAEVMGMHHAAPA